MSNPWSAVMPGGVAFPSRPADEEDWGFGAPGDPVGEADTPTTPGTGETPVPVPDPPVSDGSTSTSVDTPALPVTPPVPASPLPAVAPLPVPPVTQTPPAPLPVPPVVEPQPETPAWSGWGDWDTDEPETPAPAPVLLPGQWGTPAPAPVAAPVAETDPAVVETPTAPASPLPAATPVPVSPAPDVAPVPAAVVETPAPAVPATPAAPALVTPPTPSAAPEPHPVGVPAGHTVDTTTGELTPLPATPVPVSPTPAVAPAPVAMVETPAPAVPATPPAPARNPAPVVEDLLHGEDDWSDVEEAEAAAEAAAKAEKAKERVSRANRPVAVTERDIAILQFLARYRMATYPQIASAFGISYHALRHRMPRLAKEGLVVRRAIGKSTYSVWLPTDAGMKVADMDLAVPTLSWATVAHTLGLVDIGIRFEALGEVVVTEREIRAADTRDQPTDRMRDAADITGFHGEQARLYVVDMGEGSRQYAHIPDMVLARTPTAEGGARSVAVELELTHKPQAQWKKILTAYLNAPHIGQVIYFTHQSKVRSGILAAAKEVGADHMVRVRKFEPSEENVIPLPGRQ